MDCYNYYTPVIYYKNDKSAIIYECSITANSSLKARALFIEAYNCSQECSMLEYLFSAYNITGRKKLTKSKVGIIKRLGFRIGGNTNQLPRWLISEKGIVECF